jgi:hypothetical protein
MCHSPYMDKAALHALCSEVIERCATAADASLPIETMEKVARRLLAYEGDGEAVHEMVRFLVFGNVELAKRVDHSFSGNGKP